MTTCVISQPRFFPGLHYLHRMMAADVFVVLDSVQFNPRHEENRAKVRLAEGAHWLTVPVRQASREQLICDTHVDYGQPWQRKMWKTIQQRYARAPHFEAFGPEVRGILETQYQTLAELDRASWVPALRLLGITCRFVSASDIPVTGKGPRLLLDLCKHLNADTYLSGGFGREYLDSAEFRREGVDVQFHDYTCVPYAQQQEGFIPFLSYLDPLFNVGLDRALVAAGASAAASSTERIGA